MAQVLLISAVAEVTFLPALPFQVIGFCMAATLGPHASNQLVQVLISSGIRRPQDMQVMASSGDFLSNKIKSEHLFPYVALFKPIGIPRIFQDIDIVPASSSEAVFQSKQT